MVADRIDSMLALWRIIGVEGRVVLDADVRR